MIKEVNTMNAPQAIGAYSQAIKTDNMLFISGQIPLNPNTASIPSSIEEQTKQCLENLKEILLEANMTFANVVKCGIFIRNMEDFSKINNIYSTYFNKPYPARFVVEVSKLPKDVLIEIEAIAVVK
ncbi:MAG: RidA family protein [Alphaproteobacteria bacterium]|jgi:2-iminobutanoate/2-iminopropanoate deaminase|nr:RidA family protein [Alphaproteobacteria bacterium]